MRGLSAGPAIAAALALVLSAGSLGGCGFDIAPIEEGRMRDCFERSGERIADVDALPPGAPPPLRDLVSGDDEDRTGALEIRRGNRPPWALLVFFDGSELAEERERGLRDALARRRGSARALRLTRRLNVLVLLGRQGTFGSGPRRGAGRLLDRCFDQAAT